MRSDRNLQWTLMFADDIVIWSKMKWVVEVFPGKETNWGQLHEDRGSVFKWEAEKVEDLKYLGSTVKNNRKSGEEVKKTLQAIWNRWRESFR